MNSKPPFLPELWCSVKAKLSANSPSLIRGKGGLNFLSTVEPLLWDSSIRGTQNLVPEKCSHSLRICCTLLKRLLYSGERDTFSGS